jgi:lysophospholipase L1-like esterase
MPCGTRAKAWQARGAAAPAPDFRAAATQACTTTPVRPDEADAVSRCATVFLALVVVATACRSAAPPPDAVVVAHLGDSTTVTDYLPPDARIDRVLNARLTARYPTQRIVDVNLARNGEDIRGLFAPRRALGGLVVRRSRYEAEIHGRLPRIDVALVRYGLNDMKHALPDEFGRDLARLCDRLAADYPGVHVVLETNGFMDPAHGGHARDNAAGDVYWDVVRALARERGTPLVDVWARRRREVAAGRWDFYIRSRVLSAARFGRLVTDDAHDEEMAAVAGWFGNRHPNANGVRVIADEELRVLAATWPAGLPRAGER